MMAQRPPAAPARRCSKPSLRRRPTEGVSNIGALKVPPNKTVDIQTDSSDSPSTPNSSRSVNSERTPPAKDASGTRSVGVGGGDKGVGGWEILWTCF